MLATRARRIGTQYVPRVSDVSRALLSTHGVILSGYANYTRTFMFCVCSSVERCPLCFGSTRRERNHTHAHTKCGNFKHIRPCRNLIKLSIPTQTLYGKPIPRVCRACIRNGPDTTQRCKCTLSDSHITSLPCEMYTRAPTIITTMHGSASAPRLEDDKTPAVRPQRCGDACTRSHTCGGNSHMHTHVA